MRHGNCHGINEFKSVELVVVNAGDVNMAVKMFVNDASVISNDSSVGSPVYQCTALRATLVIGDFVAHSVEIRVQVESVNFDGARRNVTRSNRRHLSEERQR